MKTVYIDYQMSPTCSRFHHSNKYVRCLMGPMGSGKSSASCIEVGLFRAMGQKPDADMVRRTRGIIVRNSYSELATTTVKTFQKWFNPEICDFRGDKPLLATVHFPMQDGTKVNCEVIFLALDKPEDTRKLRSLEITWAYINEASEVSDYTIVEDIISRLGRYPPSDYVRDVNGNKIVGSDGKFVVSEGATWEGLVMDTNPPDDEHWIYNKFEIEKPYDWEIFHQPPAVFLAKGSTPDSPVFEMNTGQRVMEGIPCAENLQFLKKDYYSKKISSMSFERIKVFMMGEYGTIAYGRPVYPEYVDRVHYLPNVKDKDGKSLDVTVYRGLPLLLGFDFGLRYAACIIAQLSQVGQLRVVEEIVVQDIGMRKFAEDIIRPKLMNFYHGMPFISCGDPAGMQRKSTDAKTDIDILNECGIPTTPCPTNSPKARREAVVYFLTRTVEGQAGLVLSSKCPMLRKGFMGRYYYKKISTSSREEIYKAEPMKNEYSHPADALQYIATSLIMTEDMRTNAMKQIGIDNYSKSSDGGGELIGMPDLGGVY